MSERPTASRRLGDRMLDGLMTRARAPAVATSSDWLLFVHGLGESGLCFEQVVERPELARFGMLIPDLPGYGRSPHPSDEGRSLAEMADLLRRWVPGAIARIGGDPGSSDPARVVLIGHSMGGVIGQLFCESVAAASADQLGFVLGGFLDIEGNISLGDCGYSGRAEPYDEAEYARSGHRTVCEQIHQLGIEDEAHRTYYCSARLCDPATFHRHSVELVRLSRDEGLARRFARLEVPKAFLLGSPRGSAPRSKQLLSEAGVEPLVVEHAGHWPFIDWPDRFTGHLVDFLRACLS